MLIENPILPGFHPDPSLMRVDDGFYVASSTFEWFPGVQVHHSRDLVNWRLLPHPLTRRSQLDLAGNAPSKGVWAPCLSYCEGIFYLVYTNVRSMQSGFFDGHNYLVTASDITGPWSEPAALNSSGFDPSLFHDDDGRKWLLNMLWDHRPGRPKFGGIVLQEYSADRRRLVGEARVIFKGTELGATEGPHLYKHDGMYYLMVAEGGTGYGHAVTVARSRELTGPYEPDPDGPMLTSRNNPDLPLQKAGHASLTDTPGGEWYLAHLTGRPIMPQRRCPLGRETAIQKVKWDEKGWLRLENGGREPRLQVQAPQLPLHPFPPLPARDDFDKPELPTHFSTLRVPVDENWLSLTERPGYLRLRGRESLSSAFHQSLVARRVQAFRFRATTCMDFAPLNARQTAGLVCLYDTENWFYLNVTHDEKIGVCLVILRCNNGACDAPLQAPEPLTTGRSVRLRAGVDRCTLRFSFSPDGKNWDIIGPPFDFSTLSDEACRTGVFTGAFVGLCAQDLLGDRLHADFDFFEYDDNNGLPR